ncbi:MAG: DUF402 domain-containing protein [Actinomycetota bacterium]|nr:DUF402 domain-containing protein [Actinomycetota bacterium]
MVPVELRKWGDRLHWHFAMQHLGDDEHGVWLAGAPGTVLQRGTEPPIVKPDAWVLLVPASGSWIASWNAEAGPEIYVDVTSRPEWRDGTLTAVDLDLDVVRRRDGTTVLLDEDEFADHRVRFGYPEAVVAAARRTADWLMETVAARAEPFDRVGARWLAAAGAG